MPPMDNTITRFDFLDREKSSSCQDPCTGSKASVPPRDNTLLRRAQVDLPRLRAHRLVEVELALLAGPVPLGLELGGETEQLLAGQGRELGVGEGGGGVKGEGHCRCHFL